MGSQSSKEFGLLTVAPVNTTGGPFADAYDVIAALPGMAPRTVLTMNVTHGAHPSFGLAATPSAALVAALSTLGSDGWEAVNYSDNTILISRQSR